MFLSLVTQNVIINDCTALKFDHEVKVEFIDIETLITLTEANCQISACE